MCIGHVIKVPSIIRALNRQKYPHKGEINLKYLENALMKLTVYSIQWLLVLLMFSLTTHAELPVKEIAGTKVPTLAPIIKTSEKAVVNIATTAKQQQLNHPLFNNPFFREFYNIPKNYQPPKQRPQSTGSGVIINSKDGIIITNHHVIDAAEKIDVILSTGDILEAELLGSDPEVDIAVLKVKKSGLPAIALGNSDMLEVGDFVIAIGNPFGLSQTVTTGIVSALGRSGLGIEGYEDFIQTDASINPGNSGGALINLKGEVIGINTAILAPARGNVGIGFAIPMNMAMNSVNQIIEHGEVKRGQLGVMIQPLDEDLARAFKLDTKTGVLIANVQDGSTAKKAGIKSGDIITAIDGNKVGTVHQLRNAVGAKRIGDKVTVEFYRNGKKKTTNVEIGGKESLSSLSLTTPVSKKLNGLKFEAMKEGLEITAIEPNSPASHTGLRQGDLILSANQQPVANLEDLKQALTINGNKLLLQIQRGMGVFYLIIQ